MGFSRYTLYSDCVSRQRLFTSLLSPQLIFSLHGAENMHYIHQMSRQKINIISTHGNYITLAIQLKCERVKDVKMYSLIHTLLFEKSTFI